MLAIDKRIRIQIPNKTKKEKKEKEYKQTKKKHLSPTAPRGEKFSTSWCYQLVLVPSMAPDTKYMPI